MRRRAERLAQGHIAGRVEEGRDRAGALEHLGDNRIAVLPRVARDGRRHLIDHHVRYRRRRTRRPLQDRADPE